MKRKWTKGTIKALLRRVAPRLTNHELLELREELTDLTIVSRFAWSSIETTATHVGVDELRVQRVLRNALKRAA